MASGGAALGDVPAVSEGTFKRPDEVAYEREGGAIILSASPNNCLVLIKAVYH